MSPNCWSFEKGNIYRSCVIKTEDQLKFKKRAVKGFSCMILFTCTDKWYRGCCDSPWGVRLTRAGISEPSVLVWWEMMTSPSIGYAPWGNKCINPWKPISNTSWSIFLGFHKNWESNPFDIFAAKTNCHFVPHKTMRRQQRFAFHFCNQISESNS